MTIKTATNESTTMKGIVQDRYGSPDILQFKEIERPLAKDGEVLIRVHAAAVNVADWLTMSGRPYIVRPAYGGLRRPKISIRGVDVAGEVVSIGEGVQRLRPGDDVFGWCQGTFAEYARGPESHFVLKPSGLTFDEVAAVPLTAATALKNLRDVGHLSPGQKVLINGASGGVGSFAVQLARWMGAEVTAVCSTRNVELVRSLGADHVIDYTRDDFTESSERYDLILDNVMNHSLSDYRRVLAREGILILNNGTGGGAWIGTLGRMMKALVLSRFVHQPLRLAALPTVDDLPILRQLIETGHVRPVIDRTFPLSNAAEAIRYLGLGHARGKVVVTVLDGKDRADI